MRVAVGLLVAVDVGVAVRVWVAVGVRVAVPVGVRVGVGVIVDVGVAVIVGGTGVSIGGVDVTSDEVQFFRTPGRYKKVSGVAPDGIYSISSCGVYELSRVAKPLKPALKTSGPRSIIP